MAHKARPARVRTVHRHHHPIEGHADVRRAGRARVRLVRAGLAGLLLMFLLALVVSYLENGGHYP